MTSITVSLTPDQIARLLSLLECHDDETHQDWPIERELDGALLAYEEANFALSTYEERDLFDTTMGVPSEYPDTCQWTVEDFDEDGPTVRECGMTVAFGEQRALCPWHASAMDIPDVEFEQRVEAGETWSR